MKMLFTCAFCARKFLPNKLQRNRSRWHPNSRFACSRSCISALGLRKRHEFQKPLPPNELAHTKVKNAVRNGTLVKPKRCEVCNKNPGINSNGRSRLQAHHDDYFKPLKVRWLCVVCHRKITPGVCGEENSAAKFSTKQVLKIRAENKKGATGYALARKYGVSKDTVYAIINRETWRYV